MPRKLVIKVDRLSKRYVIRHKEDGSGDGLRHVISDAISSPFRRFRSRNTAPTATSGKNGSSKEDIFWALRDVSFEIGSGEVVGIIGRNGAGKSTLLKVLSRITEPTEGKVGIKGRIASLLEVGTGFHQELTGRENVFLNGAILGMSRREVRSKFDQIVDFAGVERFLDTPVKRYSSGMYVRLAFSVAAHLEPEIMIVDEVLAVGDAGFQKKCMGKMQSVANEGRTVLFVSHQMSAIEKLCQRALIMDAGRIVYDGSVDSAVQKYLEGTTIPTYSDLKTRTDRKGVGGIRFERVSFLNAAKQEHSQFSSANGFYVRIEYRLKEQGVILRGARFSVSIKNRGNVLILLSSELTTVDEIVIKQSGFVEVFVPRLPLTPQHYSVDVFCEAANEIQDWIEDAAEFEVTSGDFYGTGRTAPPGWEGRVALVDHRWDFDGQSGAT